MASERLVSEPKLVIKLAKKVRFGRIDYDDLLATIADIPTVDAVEVVRCKDCKQWNCVKKPKLCDKRHGYCLNDDEPVGRWEYDFCSYGERREGE